MRYNMLDGLKQSAKPKMFGLGEHDTLVEPQFIRQAYDEAHEPKFLYSLDSDHDYRYHPEHIDKVNEFIGDFLSKSIID